MKKRAREALSIREKAEILAAAVHLGVAAAARNAGVNRASVYRWRGRAARDGADALPPASRKGTPLPANQLAPDIQAAVIEIARELPHLGPDRAAKELAQRGIAVSASAVHSTWVRHGLQALPARAAAARKGIEGQPAPTTNSELLAELSALRVAVATLTEQHAHTMAAMDRRDRAGRAAARPRPSSKRESGNGRSFFRELFGPALPSRYGERPETPSATPDAQREEPRPSGVLSALFGVELMAEAGPQESDAAVCEDDTEAASG